MATRGTDDKVVFQSTPPGATLATSLGTGCPKTPCELVVARKTAFAATFSKRGYQDETVTVESKIQEKGALALAGDFLPPGGMAIAAADLISGAVFDHVPNPVAVTLIRAGKVRAESRKPARANIPDS